jgi:hypothetical protein
MKYLIVLFKNKERKRIIKKFKTYERAINFFDSQILKNKEIIFDKAIENGTYCSFEIGLLEKDSNNFDLYFVKDDMGRNLKINLDDPEYNILNISNYLVEELIFDISKNKKISFNKFVINYLPKGSIKLISKLNNKVVVQDDDVVNLFSLKSDEDCYRFLGILENYMFNKKRSDCIIVTDGNIVQKKYLYNLLQSKGISKSILYKQSTTHFKG